MRLQLLFSILQTHTQNGCMLAGGRGKDIIDHQGKAQDLQIC